MRLALKWLGMAKNVIIAHAMRDVELSISANAKFLLSSSFLGFFKVFGWIFDRDFQSGGH